LTARAIAGLAVPLAAAALLAWRAGSTRGQRALLGVMAAGVFTGALAVPWSVLIFAGVTKVRLLIAVDALCVAGFAAAALLTRGPLAETTPRPRDSRMAIAASVTLLAVTAAIAASSFMAGSAVMPHGEWDAWAQWNLRARFFSRGLANGAWRTAFEPVLAWSHADYPPLISTSVARLWTYARAESVAAPIALAALFTACAAAGAALSVWRTRGAARGCLAAAAMLAAPSFVRWAPSQCADITVAFFMLAAFVLWQEDLHVLAGLSAGLAAWTKNEGVAFLGVFLIVAITAEVRRDRRRALPRLVRTFAGAAPAIAAVLWFKYVLAPPSYFVAGQTLSQTLARAFDAERAEFVAKALGRELWLNGGTVLGVLPILAAFAIVRGIDRGAPAVSRWAGVATGLMAGIYFMAYLVTPLDLNWQVQTSVDRLVLQLVPLAAWSVLSFAA